MTISGMHISLTLIDHMAISAMEERGYKVLSAVQANFGNNNLIESLTVRITSEVSNTRQDVLPPMCRVLTIYTEKDITIDYFPEQLSALLVYGSIPGSAQVAKLVLSGITSITNLLLDNLDLTNFQEPLPSVRHLELKRMALSGVNLGEIFPNLESLTIKNVTIDQATLFSIGKSVTSLSIRGQDLSMMRDISFVPAGCLDLEVADCGLTGWPIDFSRKLPSGLKRLVLSVNQIRSFSLMGLPETLEHLDIRNNRIKSLDLRDQSSNVPTLKLLEFDSTFLENLKVDMELIVPRLDCRGQPRNNAVYNQLNKIYETLVAQGHNLDWNY